MNIGDLSNSAMSRSFSLARRCWATMMLVTSLVTQNAPPTLPSSRKIGENENVHQVSSGTPWRLIG